MSIPTSHLQESLKLEADAPIDLWEIVLRTSPTHLYYRYGSTVTWQGNTYEYMPIQLAQEADYATDEVGRPTLTVVNPDKIFGPFADAGLLDLATVYRRRVLQEHLLADANIYQQRVWVIGQVKSVTKQVLQVELRGAGDIPTFELPARRFMPPEFPFVRY